MLFAPIMHVVRAQESVSYTYDAAGNRIARVIVLSASNASRSTKSIKSVDNAEDPASFNDLINGRQIKIHPNPTEGRLAVEVTGSNDDNIQITVFSEAGNQLLSLKTSDGITPVDLSAFPAGIYILYLTVEGKTEHYKIIKR